MHFHRITQPHPYLETIRLWYETSFPADERRDFDELLELLTCPDMHLCGLISENQLVGFITYWQWDTVVFIEHFAIDPEQRGKQFGQQALAPILRTECHYCLLEVEQPEDDISRRRIRFYERQGFWLSPFAYAQPPYQRGSPPIPMRLMSIPAITDRETFTVLSNLIRERVYERFYR